MRRKSVIIEKEDKWMLENGFKYLYFTNTMANCIFCGCILADNYQHSFLKIHVMRCYARVGDERKIK